MNARNRPNAKLALQLNGDTDCPVCGLGDAFILPRRCDICLRCAWIDDPASYLQPDRRSDVVHVGRDRVIWSRIGIESRDYDSDHWTLDARHGPAGFAFDAEHYARILAAEP